MNEIWKPIKGYEGIYEVSSYGRVRSLDRHIVRKNDADYRLKGRVLTPKTYKRHYAKVRLIIANVSDNEYHVHRLVADAFVENPKGFPNVRHINGDIHDNRADNLAWVTQRENNNWGTRIERVQQRFIESGHARAIVQYDLKGNFIAEYPSVQEASRQTRLNRNSINQCLWGNCKRAKQFIFKYKQ